jgi:hypothetical protein
MREVTPHAPVTCDWGRLMGMAFTDEPSETDVATGGIGR